MPNIPRRKIYETMLQYEDGMIEMNVLIYNKYNFEKFLESFLNQGYPKIRVSYREIKALLIMFLEHRKYSTEEEFQRDLNHLKNNDDEVNKHIWKSKNLRFFFKLQIRFIDKMLNRNRKISDFKSAKKLYSLLDKFNSEIPKILELRRDFMK